MQAPQFQLKEMSSGVEWSLEQLKGKPVLLTFWASWCPDSSADLVQKNRFYEQMNEDSPLQFVTINVTGRERREEDPKTYVENNNYRFPVLQDEGVDTYRRYKCEGVPSTFIIDEQGEIVAQYGDKASFIDIMQSLQKVNSI